MIKAEMVLASTNESNIPLYTMKLVYPYYIHAQLCMHRVFSRSFSSFRALKTKDMIADVMKNPVYFDSHYDKEGSMSPGKPLTEEDALAANSIMDNHRYYSVLCAKQYAELGIAKEDANRLLMAHVHMSAVVTSTEWENWFNLRISNHAQSVINDLAIEMENCILLSPIEERVVGEWHIPWVTNDELMEYSIEDCLLLSAARCARTSYKKHDTLNPIPEKDIALAKRLLSCKHMSPFEHQAVARKSPLDKKGNGSYKEIKKSKNLHLTWVPHRTMVED